MTTTRINHTGHGHPNTTAARTACRTAMRATVATTMVGRGGAVHAAIMNNNTAAGTRCGSGLGRTISGRDSSCHTTRNLPADRVTCGSCRKKM